MGKKKAEKPNKKKKPTPTKGKIRQVGSAYQTGRDAVDTIWDLFDLFGG